MIITQLKYRIKSFHKSFRFSLVLARVGQNNDMIYLYLINESGPGPSQA